MKCNTERRWRRNSMCSRIRYKTYARLPKNNIYERGGSGHDYYPWRSRSIARRYISDDDRESDTPTVIRTELSILGYTPDRGKLFRRLFAERYTRNLQTSLFEARVYQIENRQTQTEESPEDDNQTLDRRIYAVQCEGGSTRDRLLPDRLEQILNLTF